MPRNMDKLWVVDLEATCEEPEPQGWKSEIIEIGLCPLLLEERVVGKALSYLVRPSAPVTAFCTDLTGLTNRLLLRQGTTLEEALRRIRVKLGTTTRCWASFGEYDQEHLRFECREKDIDYSFSASYLDVSALYRARYGFLKESPGLSYMLASLDMHPIGMPHRGAVDAWNTARLLGYLLWGEDPSYIEFPNATLNRMKGTTNGEAS